METTLTHDIDIKYIFHENIERVWYYLRNPILLYQTIPNLCINADHPLSSQIWENGNTFTITLYKQTLKYTFLDSLSEPFHKYIIFRIQIANDLNCTIKKTLYHVSNDNTTVVIYEMCKSDIYSEYQVKIVQDLFMKVLSKMESDLKMEVSDVFQYEGLCMHLSCDELIEEVINGNNIMKCNKMKEKLFKEISIEKKVELIGRIYKITDIEGNVIIYRIKSVVRDEYNMKTIIDFECLNENEYKIKMRRCTFVNIDEMNSYFSICDFFDKGNDRRKLEQLGREKLKVLTLLKELLEK